MLIGYARVSTQDQTLNLQKDALEKLGCSNIFTDTASGATTERKGLDAALAYVREGDTLVVWRLDRLGRTLKHLIETITDLSKRHIGFKSLTESIDTTTSGGKLIFHIFGALAEFERELIRNVQCSATLSDRSARPTCVDTTRMKRVIGPKQTGCPSNSVFLSGHSSGLITSARPLAG